jgi:hypothetical protein
MHPFVIITFTFFYKKLYLALLFYPKDRAQSSPKIVVVYSLLLPLKQQTMYTVHEANDYT